MTPDQSKAQETSEWLSRASQDLARPCVGSHSDRFETIRQCIVLLPTGCREEPEGVPDLASTHDIEELGEACIAIDGTLVALIEQADVLSDYAWKLRYPGSPYTPELEETEAMFSLADEMFREIQARLPRKEGPDIHDALGPER